MRGSGCPKFENFKVRQHPEAVINALVQRRAELMGRIHKAQGECTPT
jgi:hypothetical protein